MELDLHFVREKVQEKFLRVQHVPATEQLADILTKAISRPHFDTIRNKLKIISLGVLELRGTVRNTNIRQ